MGAGGEGVVKSGRAAARDIDCGVFFLVIGFGSGLNVANAGVNRWESVKISALPYSSDSRAPSQIK